MSGKFSKRTIKELSSVLFEYSNDERTAYEVERDIYNLDEIRYDETTIFSDLIGKELPKTFGHYHPKNSSGIHYPEIYAVLEGRAWYLIQRPNEKNPKIIEEIYLVEAKKNEKIIMPPGFGHVSINPGKETLKMANWIGSNFTYDYLTYENLHGSSYYALESKDKNNIDFIKNSNYEAVPELIKVRPKEIPELGISWDIPLLEMKNNPEHLEFLLKPERYLDLLNPNNCFEKI